MLISARADRYDNWTKRHQEHSRGAFLVCRCDRVNETTYQTVATNRKLADYTYAGFAMHFVLPWRIGGAPCMLSCLRTSLQTKSSRNQ